MSRRAALSGGLSNGCVYGLIAFGFVLIHKATEGVNFAQGDLMMFGAFVAFGLSDGAHFGLPLALDPAHAADHGRLWLSARLYHHPAHVRPEPGLGHHPHIALGFFIRFLAGAIWGHEPQSLVTPLVGQQVRYAGLVLGLDELAMIVVTLALTVALFLFFRMTRIGIAMQAARRISSRPIMSASRCGG